ncbi:hypothetical protein A4H97_18985 [Niastella yeongjuensis]|uniref:FTP domain-containing protein n=1 Tax=Niastella yeongjuensis TaxID=354355 RepID=A0A1V9DY72_9BACT|nr:hypothetical protein [Niastella yeongjuensis]OQP38802.1 hypothetical protein A4H97_18985 [Niastella yeongjuensis]SEO32006.1 hypothetical protein SAMN05660816_02606 [Niastella yeongjuensis]
MKSLPGISLFCLLSCLSQAQSPCDKIKYLDKLAMAPSELPVQDFKLFDYNQIPDSVKSRLQNEIIQETSAAFFRELTIKSVRYLDSVINEKLFTPVVMLDRENNPVNFVYAIFYEMKFKGDIPFVFKLEVKQNGELLKKGQFEGIVNQKKKIIPCTKALTIAATDKEAPITKPGDIYIYYNQSYKTIVWQIMEADNTTGDSQHVTVINVFDGEILERNEFLKGMQEFDNDL